MRRRRGRRASGLAAEPAVRRFALEVPDLGEILGHQFEDVVQREETDEPPTGTDHGEAPHRPERM